MSSSRAGAARRGAGQWITRCQYHQIPPSERAPARDTAVSLEQCLRRILRDLDLEGAALQRRLEARWDELVGRPLAGQSRPGPLENGALTLFVRSATWKFEIERHLRGPLLKKLRQQLPELGILRLAVRIDPGRYEPPAPGSPRRP